MTVEVVMVTTMIHPATRGRFHGRRRSPMQHSAGRDQKQIKGTKRTSGYTAPTLCYMFSCLGITPWERKVTCKCGDLYCSVPISTHLAPPEEVLLYKAPDPVHWGVAAFRFWNLSASFSGLRIELATACIIWALHGVRPPTVR
jgi:hypothetical protein